MTDAAGLPLAGAELWLEGTTFRAHTDADGRYRIAGVRPGRFRLVARAMGFRPGTADLDLGREGETLRRDFALEGDPVPLREILTLVERAAASDRQVVRREELLRAGSVAAALARVPGVFVKAFGANGPQELSLRGGSPEQTLVLWGEERLSGPAGGAIDLSTLAPAAIDSIEVIPRGASSRYGSGALGGVVRIHPRSAPVTGGELEARAAAGSFGERGVSGRLTFGGSRTALGLDGALRGYAESFGRGAGSDGSQRDVSLSLRGPVQGLVLRAAAHASDRGAPGPLPNPTPRARIENERTLGSARYDTRAGSWDLGIEGSIQVASASYADPDRPALGAESRETSVALRGRTALVRGSHRPEAGLELRGDRFRSDAVEGRPRRTGAALFLVDRWRPDPAGPLAVAAGVRVDHLELAGAPAALGPEPRDPSRGDAARALTFVSPSLSASLELSPELALRAQAGRSFRAPGFQNLFFVSGVGVRSNPDLREERSREAEVALEWTPPLPVSGSAAVFERRIDGAIVWLPDFQFVWSPRNLPRSLVRGVELSATWRPGPRWSVDASYTYAPARFDFRGNHHPLPYRPAHLGRLEIGYAAGQLRTAVQLGLTGARHPNLAGTNPLGGHVLVGCRVEYLWSVDGADLGFELAIDNALDRRHEVVFGFPGAGRSARASLSYRRR